MQQMPIFGTIILSDMCRRVFKQCILTGIKHNFWQTGKIFNFVFHGVINKMIFNIIDNDTAGLLFGKTMIIRIKPDKWVQNFNIGFTTWHGTF